MSSIFPVFALVIFAGRRLLTYLHLFQQEEYDNDRFFRWLVKSGAFDRRLSGTLIAIGLVQFLVPITPPSWLFPTLAGAACLAVAALERDPRKTAKKCLAMTARATRIYVIALVLVAVVAALAAIATRQALIWLIPVQLVPLALIAANLLLAPFEVKTQRRYWDEAQARLRQIGPVVIAITG